MAIGGTHPDYDAATPQWSRARDVLAGEDAVKAAGTKYLPRLDSQSEEEYAAYKARASFFGATARTLEEYLDLVFRRAPTSAAGESPKVFLRDCDRWGTGLLQYARRVGSEVLSVGRAGSLVLLDSGRPCVSFWRTEEIPDWCVDWVGQRAVLTRLVLKAGTRRRELRIVDSEFVQEVWSQVEGEWVMDGFGTLRRDGVLLSFIPFVFHGPRHSRPERDRLPLGEMTITNQYH